MPKPKPKAQPKPKEKTASTGFSGPVHEAEEARSEVRMGREKPTAITTGSDRHGGTRGRGPDQHIGSV
jgi:hypothetical protein